MTPAEDPSLVAGSAAHYEDPSYYTKTYAKRKADVLFYVACAEAIEGPVLEIGCGNGRITLALANAGATVVGLDLSQPMLDDLRSRLAVAPKATSARVTTHHADMRDFALGRRFPLVICPFNALLHLYTRPDFERFFACVREHLAPSGQLIFDVSIPQPEELARDPERLFRTPPFVYPGVGRVRYGERFDYEALSQVLYVSMEFEPEQGDSFVTPLCHRQIFPQELEALLHYNGFSIVELVGDFEGRPTHTTQQLVVKASLR